MQSFFSCLLLMPLLVVGQTSPIPLEINEAYKNLTGCPIPTNAENVQMEPPTNQALGQGGYSIISYSLDPNAFNNVMSETHPNFGQWKPFTELQVGPHLFSSKDMRNSMLSKKKNGDITIAILLDFDHNKVYALAFSG